MANKVKINTGKLLLSEPFMADPYFKRAVVLLCEHHKHGSVGFILNKSIDMGINELVIDFPYFEADVYYGGPVQTDTLHFVHTLGEVLKESIKIADGVYWGGDFEQLKHLIEEKKVKAGDIRFFVGYSGWGSGQLSNELETGSWVMADLKSKNILNATTNDLWQDLMYNKGNTYEVIAHIPDFLSWN